MSTIYCCEIVCANCKRVERDAGVRPGSGNVEKLRAVLKGQGWTFEGKRAYCPKCKGGK